MAVFSIVGYRRSDDGVPGSWTPDVPTGTRFQSISGDTTNQVRRLRAGTDADSPTAHPDRLCVIRTPAAFASPSRVPLGSSIGGRLHADGRFLIESAIGRSLPVNVTVRAAIFALLESWSDDDLDQPNTVKPSARGRMKIVLGDDVIVDRPATQAENDRRGRGQR